MKWEDIARHFDGRTSTACRLRYQNYLEKKHDWNDEKKKSLAVLYERYVAKTMAICYVLNTPSVRVACQQCLCGALLYLREC